MSSIRAIVAASIQATPHDYAAAERSFYGVVRWGGVPSCYVETAVRSTMRKLLDGAGDTNSTVRLGFIKKDGTLRHMLALPCPSVDGTNQFYTCKDLELSLAAQRPVYRRVNLDAIVAAQVDFHMGRM
jgi:hypothetical protein